MKLSNFELVKIKGKKYIPITYIFIAEVDITTGILWWKKTRRVKIGREIFSSYWFFLDSGKYTPDYQAENLERAWEALNGRLEEQMELFE